MSGYRLQKMRRILPLKQLGLLFILSVFAITAGFQIQGLIVKDVRIIDNGKTISAKTMGYDVQQAMNQLEVNVKKVDYTNLPYNTVLNGAMANVLIIQRAVPVTLYVDGTKREVMSYRSTVEEVLKDEYILLSSTDRIEGLQLADPVVSGMEIKIVRVREEMITENEPISFDVIQKLNNQLNNGITKVVIEGSDGLKGKIYKLVYEDNKIVSRTFIEDKIVTDAVDRVIEVGTVQNFTNNRGDIVRFSKVISDVRSTAYTSSFADTGKSPGHPQFGITRSGMKAREGIIAVDPRLIPLGTKMYIEIPGPAPDYGFAIAGDIGSAIKGKHIDLYFDTSEAVKQWGNRTVKVYILNEQDDSRWQNNVNPCK